MAYYPVSFALSQEIIERIDYLQKEYNFRNKSALLRFVCERFLFDDLQLARIYAKQKAIDFQHAKDLLAITLDKKNKEPSKIELEIQERLKKFAGKT